jgi:hypothetical protein
MIALLEWMWCHFTVRSHVPMETAGEGCERDEGQEMAPHGRWPGPTDGQADGMNALRFRRRAFA